MARHCNFLSHSRVVPCEPDGREMTPSEFPDDDISAMIEVIAYVDRMIPSRTVIL